MEIHENTARRKQFWTDGLNGGKQNERGVFKKKKKKTIKCDREVRGVKSRRFGGKKCRRMRMGR